jgi:hypothetical protein
VLPGKVLYQKLTTEVLDRNWRILTDHVQHHALTAIMTLGIPLYNKIVSFCFESLNTKNIYIYCLPSSKIVETGNNIPAYEIGDRVDAFWAAIQRLKDSATGKQLYPIKFVQARHACPSNTSQQQFL